jgi:uncharacterized cupredoxin-like copper-binding protein
VRRVAIVLGTALATVTAGVLTGCGSERPAAASHATVIRVSERDFQIVVRPKRFAAGEVRVVFDNSGPDDHELIIVRAERPTLPLRADGLTVNEEALRPVTVATVEPMAPGSAREVRLRLAPGRYSVFCNMAGHFMAGMHASFVVGS